MDFDAFVAQALAARNAARPMVSLLINDLDFWQPVRNWLDCCRREPLASTGRGCETSSQSPRYLLAQLSCHCLHGKLQVGDISATSRAVLQAGRGSGHSLASSGHSAASLLPERLWPGSPATPLAPHSNGPATLNPASTAPSFGGRQLPGAPEPQQHAQAQQAPSHPGWQPSGCQSALGHLGCQAAQHEPLAAAAAAAAGQAPGPGGAAGLQQLPHSGAEPAHQPAPASPYSRAHSAAPHAEHQQLEQGPAGAGRHQQQRGRPPQQVGQGPTAGQAGWGGGAMQQPAQGQRQTHDTASTAGCQVAELPQRAGCSVPSLASAQQPRAGEGCLRGTSGGSGSASSMPFAAFCMTAPPPQPGVAHQQPGPAGAMLQHGQQPGARDSVTGREQPQRQQENAGALQGSLQGSRQQQGPGAPGQQRPLPGQGPLMHAELQLGPEGYLLLRVAYHERLTAALRR